MVRKKLEIESQAKKAERNKQLSPSLSCRETREAVSAVSHSPVTHSFSLSLALASRLATRTPDQLRDSRVQMTRKTRLRTASHPSLRRRQAQLVSRRMRDPCNFGSETMRKRVTLRLTCSSINDAMIRTRRVQDICCCCSCNWSLISNSCRRVVECIPSFQRIIG